MSAPAMPAAQLALRLEDTAAGICADTAAVGLICSHGHFLRQPGFRRLVAAGSSIYSGKPVAVIRWKAAIHALEHGDPLVPAAVRRYPTAHPRCGTEFLVVVILLSIVAFSLVGRQSAVVMVGSRILLIPVIAMVGYELLRLGARYRANPVIRVIMWPGILVQRITTKQPTDDMIEVAIVSLEQALAADGQPIPAGSSDIPRDPLELGSTGEAEPVVRAAEAGPVPERLPSEPPARDG